MQPTHAINCNMGTITATHLATTLLNTKGATSINKTCATNATMALCKLAPNSSRTAPEGMSGLGLTHPSNISSWMLTSSCLIFSGLPRAGGVIWLTPGPPVPLFQGGFLEATLSEVSSRSGSLLVVLAPPVLCPLLVNVPQSALTAQQCKLSSAALHLFT